MYENGWAASVVNEQHHTSQLDAQNSQLQAKVFLFPISKKGKENSSTQATAKLQHFGTQTSDICTEKLNTWIELLEYTQQ